MSSTSHDDVRPLAARNPLFSSQEWTLLCRELSVTGRQADVLKGVIQGLPDRRIAELLGIAPPTVRTHLQKLFRRLRVRDRTDMVIAVFRKFRELHTGGARAASGQNGRSRSVGVPAIVTSAGAEQGASECVA